jgi:hypothetical protein
MRDVDKLIKDICSANDGRVSVIDEIDERADMKRALIANVVYSRLSAWLEQDSALAKENLELRSKLYEYEQMIKNSNFKSALDRQQVGKVRCIAKYDTSPYGSNYEQLEIGKEYTVTHVEQNGCYSMYRLLQLPGREYNSVLFEEVRE